jgi:hypothetical protein
MTIRGQLRAIGRSHRLRCRCQSARYRGRVLSRSAAVALRRSGGVVSDALLAHYRGALAQIRAVGYFRYGARPPAPYARAAVAAFHPGRETLTGRLFGKP